MKQLHNFIHKESYINQQEIRTITEKAIDLVPKNKIYYLSTWETLKQQIQFLPLYTICIQISLVIFQLYIIQQHMQTVLTISFICTLQILFTCFFALRAKSFAMHEIEQVSRCGTRMLFFIRYIIISFFLYPELLTLMLFSIISTKQEFFRISLVLCILYHVLSICILYSYGKGQFSATKKTIIDGSLYALLGIFSCFILLNASTLILSLATIISILSFYIFFHKIIRKEKHICR